MIARVDDRLKIIGELLNFSWPLQELATQLSSMSWDYAGEGVVLERQHLISVLQRYLAGDLAGADIESWANLIEGREDIEFSTEYEEELENALYELANPTLTYALNVERANTLLQSFS